MTKAIFFKELSQILDIPSLQYISIFIFFLNKVQSIFKEYTENTLVYNFQIYTRNCRQTKIHSIIKTPK